MVPVLREHLEEITALCRKYGVKKLELVGSAARENFDPASSDIDLFYEFDANRASLSDRFFGLMEDLQQLLGHPVDLVSSVDAVNPYFLQVANRYRTILYAA